MRASWLCAIAWLSIGCVGVDDRDASDIEDGRCNGADCDDACARAVPDAQTQPELATLHDRAMQLRAEIDDPSNQARAGTTEFKGSAYYVTMLVREAMAIPPTPASREEYEERLQWVSQVLVGVGHPAPFGTIPAFGQHEIDGAPSGFDCGGGIAAHDTEPMFDDCSDNQAFHSFFYVWLSYFSGEAWASIGNNVHEQGFLPDTIAVISPMGGSLQDYLVGVAAIKIGRALRDGRPLPAVYPTESIDVAYGARYPSLLPETRLRTVSDSTGRDGHPDESEDNRVATWARDDGATVSMSKYFFDEIDMATVLANTRAISPELLSDDVLARVGLSSAMTSRQLQQWLFETPVTFENLDVIWWLVVGNVAGRTDRPCAMACGASGSQSELEVRGLMLEQPHRLGLAISNR